MQSIRNELGQPIGVSVPDWKAVGAPACAPMLGRTCRLEPVEASRHGPELWDAVCADRDGRMWTYLPYGPFSGYDAYREWLEASCAFEDPRFFAIVPDNGGRAIGVASYLRIDRICGSIEVGHVQFSPLLQRTTVATEAMFLMMKRAFELGYRRYEWKCDALNAASRRCAERLGFQLEGIFRQAVVYKGRNRDTAWYSILDQEWPAVGAGIASWLDASNFGPDGLQIESLATKLGAGSLKRHG